MKEIIVCLCLLALCSAKVDDWLVKKITVPAKVIEKDDRILLDNGLLRREFLTKPGFGTVSIYSYTSDNDLLRAISPEATVTLDGNIYYVGDLIQHSHTAYMNITNPQFDRSETAFHFHSYTVKNITAPYDWTPGSRGTDPSIRWPPEGIEISFKFSAPSSAPETYKDLFIYVHYELYVGIPLISKYITVEKTKEDIYLSSVIVDTLRTSVPYDPQMNGPSNIEVGPSFEHLRWFYDMTGMIYIETDLPHGTKVDWSVTRNSNTPGSRQPEVNVGYTSTLTLSLLNGFTSFHSFLLVTDSMNIERHSLAIRQMKRLLAPQIQENPIFFHTTEASLEGARKVIDNIADVGFEMMIFSFGSDFNYEAIDNEQYVSRFKNITEYARSKGIEVGGYDLIVWTRDPGEEYRRINPETHQGTGDACFASEWKNILTNRIDIMMEKTGMSMFETDGPYPGYECESENHIYHKNKDDSVYYQTIYQSEFFKHYRNKNTYINQPDYYIYHGANKHSMGYDESQFSLPKNIQLLISRQTMYDNTYYLVPSEGWMFLPIVQYHGGGSEASFIPLEQNIKQYELGVFQYLMSGVAACYRGPYMYDTENTKIMVKKWVDLYKKYRYILNGDIVHILRPTNNNIDMYMHVNPFLDTQGFLLIFNPTEQAINKTVSIPLYYTGIENKASFRLNDDIETIYNLNRDYSIDLPIHMEPESFAFYVIQKRD